MAIPNDRQCQWSPMDDRFCHARDGVFIYPYANEAARRSLGTRRDPALYELFSSTPNVRRKDRALLTAIKPFLE